MTHRSLSAAVLLLATVSGIGLTACSTTAPAVSAAKPASAAAADARLLPGTWTVDLRPNPGSPPYLKAFVVSSVSGNTFQGSFYDTPITEGRINTDWGTVRIAFVTADGSGSYHHSAVLSGGRLEGLSHAPSRGFLAYWSAVRP